MNVSLFLFVSIGFLSMGFVFGFMVGWLVGIDKRRLNNERKTPM